MNETVLQMLAIITFKGFEFKLLKSKSEKGFSRYILKFV